MLLSPCFKTGSVDLLQGAGGTILNLYLTRAWGLYIYALMARLMVTLIDTAKGITTSISCKVKKNLVRIIPALWTYLPLTHHR